MLSMPWGLWITRKNAKDKRDDAAVRSVLTALNTTKGYIARRVRGEAIDRRSESNLVDFWTSAAIQIRRSDSDLAIHLQQKAEYWTNPENWTEQEVRKNRIQIDEIAAEATKLLRPS